MDEQTAQPASVEARLEAMEAAFHGLYTELANKVSGFHPSFITNGALLEWLSTQTHRNPKPGLSPGGVLGGPKQA